MKIDYVFTAILFFLGIVGIECAIRYVVWFYKVMRDESQLLKGLLLGTFFHQTAFSGFVAIGLVNIYWFDLVPHSGRFFCIRFSSDALAAVAVTLNLISYWRVSRGYRGREILIAVSGRICLALSLTAAAEML